MELKEPPFDPKQLIIYANFCSVPTRQSKDSGLLLKCYAGNSLSYFETNSTHESVLEKGLCFKESVIDYTHVMTQIGATVMVSLMVVTPKQGDDSGYLIRQKSETVDLNALGFLRILLNSEAFRSRSSFVSARAIGGGELVWRREVNGDCMNATATEEHFIPSLKIPADPSLKIPADHAKVKGSCGPFVTILVEPITSPTEPSTLSALVNCAANYFMHRLTPKVFFELTGGTSRKCIEDACTLSHNLRLDLRIGSKVSVPITEAKARALGLEVGTTNSLLEVVKRSIGPDVSGNVTMKAPEGDRGTTKTTKIPIRSLQPYTTSETEVSEGTDATDNAEIDEDGNAADGDDDDNVPLAEHMAAYLKIVSHEQDVRS